MGKLSYNDKLHMWQVSHCLVYAERLSQWQVSHTAWFTQNG